jgi:hypothetical protein
MKTLRRLLLLSMYALAALSIAVAQTTPLITRVTTPLALEKRPLSVSAEMSKSTGVARVLLYYRSYGENEYKELEMLVAGRVATATIPAVAVLPPYIEYYIEARLDNGKTETFPVQNAQANPQRIAVKAADPKDLEVRILSPEPGETVDVEELVVAISFFYASENVKPEATKIFLDDTDVTAKAVLSDDVLLYSPKSAGQPMSLGSHRLRIELYDTQGKLYHTLESSFNASTAAAIAAEEARFQTLIDGQAEYRNENIQSIGTNTTYIRGDLRLNGSYSWLGFGATTHIDNQEDPSRQPQNRYLLYANTSILSIQVGDAYPKFPSYIVSGKRVRGVSGNLRLGFFNLDVSLGETNRSVEGTRLYDTTYADSSTAASRPKNSALLSGLRYTIFQPGTFQRDFFAIRPSFGSGENFQLGFTYLKAKDQTGSIKYGTFPEENLVVGTDLLLAFDDQRIKLETQASLSIKNTDISKGNITDEELKNLKKEDADNIRKIRDAASTFITINQNLFPLNPLGEGLPGVSYEGVLSLNYFNNFLRGSVFKRGAAYSSFGNEFLQTDIEGYNISDRIRMFENKVFLSIAYEKRNDNTANNKIGTTNFDFFNSTITVIPGVNLPSFTVGYGVNNQVSDNKISRYDLVPANNRSRLSRADSLALVNARTNAIDNATNQLYVAANYDFNAGARQSLTFSLSSTNRKDNTLYKRDQTNLNLQVSLTTSFSSMFQTTVGYLLSQNETKNQLFTTTGRDSTLLTTPINYSTASITLLTRLLDERLRILASASPTFGDFNRTIVRGGIDYAVTERHVLAFSFDFIQNSGTKDDTIASLIYRFSF